MVADLQPPVQLQGGHLNVDTLASGYGKREILHQVTMDFAPGKIHLVIGHNGAGKTTLLRTLLGSNATWAGKITLDGRDIHRLSPSERVKAGVSMVPQENIVFPSLTVKENLRLALYPFSRLSFDEGLSRVDEVFPELIPILDRRAGVLSGGQQRMCAVARPLVALPTILCLDEPSVGLSPVLVDRVLEAIERINRQWGITVLLVEQNIIKAAKVTEHVYAIQRGAVVLSETGDRFRDRDDLYEFL